ncbi:MAG: UDP-N-acetylmuramoyl-L-alanyl-D-glutamate--2,6-diaminopimelate ligase [Ruminococcus sp.]|nr:UDP-N-acetylmuramoyl-L-alanyl-D-glutamate--2,6-diaminopimelate ligase [Ruminococcus sp.]
MLLSNLLKNVNFNIIKGNIDTEITDIIYDSRKVTQGTAFVALKGYNVDGHKFIPQAISQGASAVVVSDDFDTPQDITVIKVDDTRKALAYMSAMLFGEPAKELTTIALTGTKGKTTTVAMLKSILNAEGISVGTIGTLGIIIGDKIYKTNNTTPESYEIQKAMRKMADKGCKAMIIEASSLGLKWHRTDAIDFDYGVFTNFSHDHIGDSEHKDLQEYLDCKALLFKQCKNGIFNIDDNVYEEITANATCTKTTYGFSDKADITAYGDKLISRPGYIGVHFSTNGLKTMDVDVDIPGKFSVYNALAAMTTAIKMGISEEAILKGLDTVTVKGRVEAVPVPGDYTLLIDYAHNALSMENILETLREYNPNRLIVLFGAGGNRPKVRRYEMGETAGRLADLSVLTEDNSRDEDVMDIINDIIEGGIKKTEGKYVVVPKRQDAIRYCMENAEKGDIIVLAGKGHEDYLEIKGVKYHLDEREVIADIIADMKK